LIAWSIDLAGASGRFVDVLVSTDDEQIAEVARRHGALVPWLRPADLASDTAGSVDVALHALDWYEASHGPLDALVLLQPTSPFRSSATVNGALDLFVASERSAVVSVAPAPAHPAWCYRMGEEGIEPFLGWEMAEMRSQDLPPAFVTDGSVYVIAPATLRSSRSFTGPGTRAFVVRDASETLDIDTAEDWAAAEQLLAKQR
jgi:CMP-N-acetylneuraminic acid synthetase